jgi:hypothetical protein
MRLPKKPEIDMTDLGLRIKEHITVIEEMKKNYVFSRALAELVWDTRSVMNVMGVIAPHDQYALDQKSKYMIHFSKDFGKEINVFGPTIEFSNDGAEISPAYVSDGISDALDDSCDRVSQFIHSVFTIPEQVELFETILQWYENNFIISKCEVEDSIFECLRRFGEKVKKIINKNGTHHSA